MVYRHTALVLVLHGLFLYSEPLPDNPPRPPTPTSLSMTRCQHSFRLSEAIFKPNVSLYIPQHPETQSPFTPPAYEDGTVFRKVGIQISDAGALPTRKHTIKYEQSVQPRSTAAASRHTGCPNDTKHTFRPVNKHAPSEQLRR